MPGFRRHVSVGVVLGLLLLVSITFYMENPVLGFNAFMLSVLGSVLPDVDHKNSYIFRAVRSSVSIGFLFIAVYVLPYRLGINFLLSIGLAASVFYSLTALRPKHRGITHSMVFLVGSTSISFLSLGVESLGLFLGILSHLVLDEEMSLI